MGLVDRIRAIVDPMPADGAVTLPVAFLRALLDAEGDEPGMGRLLTLAEAGEVVGRSPSTIRTWLNTGRLDGFKLNARSWRVRESALQNFIQQQEAGDRGAAKVLKLHPNTLRARMKKLGVKRP